MRYYLMVIVVMVCTMSAQDITVSKDSLRIYNNPVSRFNDNRSIEYRTLPGGVLSCTGVRTGR